ncbi:MAG: hypothetical protein GEU88_17250 [Solirubrobacterales bacterium]|nr:hypothetical protein [Solirubrobacterales bacterium]
MRDADYTRELGELGEAIALLEGRLRATAARAPTWLRREQALALADAFSLAKRQVRVQIAADDGRGSRVVAAADEDAIEVGALRIEPARRAVTVSGAAVRMTAKEYELLRALAREPHRVFTKHELLRDVWGFRSRGRTRTVDTHASRLRRKLDGAPGRLIVNVWGVGYRLVDEDSEAVAA